MNIAYIIMIHKLYNLQVILFRTKILFLLNVALKMSNIYKKMHSLHIYVHVKINLQNTLTYDFYHIWHVYFKTDLRTFECTRFLTNKNIVRILLGYSQRFNATNMKKEHTESQKVLVTAFSLRSFSILSLINVEMDCSPSPNFLSATQN